MRWEYRRAVIESVGFTRGEADAEMDRLGKEGWELTVAVPRDKHGYQHEVCLIFKRPAPEAS
ncbi:MAG: DUF4177 domain-containing protein [Labilithrix sp.]|nr:DUF4177 domain-containing protein [Labilithrix sp.]